MPHGQTLANLLKVSIGMAEKQLTDIPAGQFARKPQGASGAIDTNHPAFVYGHLTLYPSNLLTLLGLNPGQAPKPPAFEELFAAGKPCLDDPSGTIYPSMKTITESFFAAHRPAVELLAGVDDAVFARPHPREQARARFPLVGDAATFYVTSHMMFHLGQVSAWRRCFGLSPVM